MTIFRPQLAVNLRLRFERQFTIRTRDGAQPLLEGSSQETSFVFNIVPRTASVELNGYRQAAKFDLQFNFSDFPLDPRIIRAAGVEVHLGTVPDADWGAGVTQPATTNIRRSQLETIIDGEINDETILIVGLIDSAAVEHTNRGSFVRVDGRDLRGILLDSPANPSLFNKLDLTQAIDKVVRQILDIHPFGDRIIVEEPDPAEWNGGTIPSPGTKDGITRVNRGADGSKSQGGKPSASSNDLNYWDLITRYCYLVGAIPYFQGQFLRIRPARSLLDQVTRKDIPTPFAGGLPREGAGADGRVRRFVYGRDIDTVTYERKYTGVRAPTIECICLDTSSRERGDAKLLVVQWPPKKPGDTDTTNDQDSDKEKLRIPVSGISDKSRLLDIAKAVFEEVSRGEQGGSCSTKTLASYGGDNDDPDVLRLRVGDTVEFLTSARLQRPPVVADLIEQEDRTFEEQVKVVADALGDEALARVLVATARGDVVELRSYYRTSNVRFDWDIDSGVGVSFDFQNYVVVASEASRKEDREVLPKAGKKTQSFKARLQRAKLRAKKRRAHSMPGGSNQYWRGTKFEEI